MAEASAPISPNISGVSRLILDIRDDHNIIPKIEKIVINLLEQCSNNDIKQKLRAFQVHLYEDDQESLINEWFAIFPAERAYLYAFTELELNEMRDNNVSELERMRTYQSRWQLAKQIFSDEDYKHVQENRTDFLPTYIKYLNSLLQHPIFEKIWIIDVTDDPESILKQGEKCLSIIFQLIAPDLKYKGNSDLLIKDFYQEYYFLVNEERVNPSRIDRAKILRDWAVSIGCNLDQLRKDRILLITEFRRRYPECITSQEIEHSLHLYFDAAKLLAPTQIEKSKNNFKLLNRLVCEFMLGPFVDSKLSIWKVSQGNKTENIDDLLWEFAKWCVLQGYYGLEISKALHIYATASEVLDKKEFESSKDNIYKLHELIKKKDPNYKPEIVKIE